ncbi:MAG: KpsF/GutQ family sugar-phosphate isomerase [Mariprofundaceae bacterium]|nr:KpsF/GutQ family sugar-phosphate isomerase [Mariprofundaceae bacterium]
MELTSGHTTWLEDASDVFDIEMKALQAQKEALNQQFVQAIELILSMQGRLVVVGMGKSGIIARKIAATFASTGTISFFVHAAEAQHGDLGMISHNDVVLALSHSGETSEVCNLLPTIKSLGSSVIAMTGNKNSTLAKYSDVVLHIPVTQEACPMNLAPTASTTAALALGDALAVVTLQQRQFKREDFARVHPAGSLGRQLMCMKDVMHQGSGLPVVTPSTPLHEAIVSMSKGRLGIVAVVEDAKILGCLSDGDLRRILQTKVSQLDRPVIELMHQKPHTLLEDTLVDEGIAQMEAYKITVLFIVNEKSDLVGAVHLHDLIGVSVH